MMAETTTVEERFLRKIREELSALEEQLIETSPRILLAGKTELGKVRSSIRFLEGI